MSLGKKERYMIESEKHITLILADIHMYHICLLYAYNCQTEIWRRHYSYYRGCLRNDIRECRGIKTPQKYERLNKGICEVRKICDGGNFFVPTNFIIKLNCKL